MIVFKKFRRVFSGDKNLSKYIRYAFGEIILIVLGILIAISLNNWNEQRKTEELQKEILSQVKINLQKDRSELKLIQQTAQNAVQYSDKLNEAYKNGERPDSLDFWLGRVIYFDRFQPLTNAYEVLKSQGLHKMKNKDLIFLLGSYYDDQAYKTQKSAEDLEKAFNTELVPALKKYAIDFKFKVYIKLREGAFFDKDSELINLVNLNRDNYAGAVFRIGKALNIIDEIIKNIDQEL